MAAVNVTNVSILNNPSLFSQPLQFEIQYECVTNLADGKSERFRTPQMCQYGLKSHKILNV